MLMMSPNSHDFHPFAGKNIITLFVCTHDIFGPHYGIMMVADALEPNRHQSISSHYADLIMTILSRVSYYVTQISSYSHDIGKLVSLFDHCNQKWNTNNSPIISGPLLNHQWNDQCGMTVCRTISETTNLWYEGLAHISIIVCWKYGYDTIGLWDGITI